MFGIVWVCLCVLTRKLISGYSYIILSLTAIFFALPWGDPVISCMMHTVGDGGKYCRVPVTNHPRPDTNPTWLETSAVGYKTLKILNGQIGSEKCFTAVSSRLHDLATVQFLPDSAVGMPYFECCCCGNQVRPSTRSLSDFLFEKEMHKHM